MNIRTGFLAALFWLLLPLPVWAAVNVNTATSDELRTVRGIGPAIAKRIIDERGKGPFKSLDDLQARVRGIGEATARKFAAGGLTVGALVPRRACRLEHWQGLIGGHRHDRLLPHLRWVELQQRLAQ